jgi:hypothetical protein
MSTSMRMPKAFHQALMKKSREIGLSLPKTLAYLFDQSQKQLITQAQPDYGLLIDVLLQEAIHHFVEKGQGLIDQVLQKSESLGNP